MKLFKLRKVLTKARKQHKSFYLAFSAVTFLLLLYLAGVVFGVDQYLIKTPMEGTVSTEDGRGLADAEVMLQGSKTKTDENGKFKFEDVKFGTYEIVVDMNGYVRYSEKVKIKRFSNHIDISMRAQEYGEVKLIFETNRAIDKNLNIRINNQPFPIQTSTDKFVVDTGRLLVGNYLLEMNSPDFVDFSEKFNLKSGKTELVYKLQASGDVVAEFRDYLSEEIVEPDEIIVTIDEQIVELSEMETPGKFELNDIEIGKEYKVLVKQSDYIDREVKLFPKQGLNSLGNVYLFIDDNVIYTEKGKIISSYINGSNRKELYESTDRCRIVMTRALYTVISCGSSYLLYERKGADYELVREYVVTGGKYDLNIKNLQMVILDTNLKSIQQLHSSINTTDLYIHDKEIDSIVVDTQGVIYFSDNEAVFKLVGTSAEKIVDGNYRIEEISPDNNTIIALGNRLSGQSNIWSIEISSKIATKITFLPNDYKEISFEGPDKVYYLVGNELFIGSISQNNFTKISEGIDSYWLNEGSNFITVQEDNATQFLSKINYNKKPIFSNE